MSAADALNLIQECKAKFIDFRFTDTKGKEQHVSVPASAVDEEVFEEGKMFDLPLNKKATEIWHDKLSKFNSNPNYVPQDYLVGTVLILRDKALMQ